MNKQSRIQTRVAGLAGKRFFYPVLAFLLPLLTLMAAYAAMEVWPFGDHATAIIDSYHQYVPFIAELHDKIWTGESLLYSWHGSLGFNFWAVIAYYLASPLNFLIAIFPAGMMLEVFETLILVKIGLSAVTASYYLKCRSGKWNIAVVLFAQFYAMGGFTAAYYWNVMWLDCIVLFPLVVLGAQRLIDEADGRLYVIALGLTIYCNYYIAIMVCLFQILYFFIYWFQRVRPGFRQFLKRGMLYAGCSLLSGGLGAVFLLPTYFVLLNSSKGSPPSSWKFYRSFLDVFKQQFVLIEPTQLEGAPNIYCGLLIGLLVVFFAMMRVIPLRERLLRLGLSSFILISLNVNVIDYVWHGLHFPNNLPGRYSFLYIFLMVEMAYDAFCLLGTLRRRWYAAAGVVTAVLFAACLIWGEEEIPLYASLTTGLVTEGYLFFLVLQKNGLSLQRKRLQIYPLHLLLILMTAELMANSIYASCMNGNITRSLYLDDLEDMAAYRASYASSEKPYRMELGQTEGRDDVTRYHLNGLSFFSSTCDDRMEELVGALGLYKAGNKYTYEGATPLTDAMMGIRYIASKKGLTAYNLRQVDTIGEENIYENRRELPIGYMVQREILDWVLIEKDPFMIQNDFARLAAGTEEKVFSRLETPQPEISGGEISSTEDSRWYYSNAGEGEMTFHLSFEETQDIYVYFEASHCTKMKLDAYDNSLSYDDQRGHIVHIGVCGGGAEVTLTFPFDTEYSSGNVALQIAAFDSDAFEDVYDTLTDGRLNVSSYDSTHIKGSMTAHEDGILMLSIPFDEGWKIMVDGEKAEQFPVGEGLMGIDLAEGEHTVNMSYIPVGFIPGLLITAASLLIWILYVRYVKRKRRQREEMVARLVEELTAVK